MAYVTQSAKVTCMKKTRVRSVPQLVRDAIRKTVLKPQVAGPVAIWDGESRRTSIEHDSVHDEP